MLDGPQVELTVAPKVVDETDVLLAVIAVAYLDVAANGSPLSLGGESAGRRGTA